MIGFQFKQVFAQITIVKLFISRPIIVYFFCQDYLYIIKVEILKQFFFCFKSSLGLFAFSDQRKWINIHTDKSISLELSERLMIIQACRMWWILETQTYNYLNKRNHFETQKKWKINKEKKVTNKKSMEIRILTTVDKHYSMYRWIKHSFTIW